MRALPASRLKERGHALVEDFRRNTGSCGGVLIGPAGGFRPHAAVTHALVEECIPA